MSVQYSMKSDVYSFGVVMLELLTGWKPFDRSRPRSEQSLVRWATPQLHDIDALDRMVDPALQGLYPSKSLSRFADVIALCVQFEPKFRLPMSEVVQLLVRLVQRANMTRTCGADGRSWQRDGESGCTFCPEAVPAGIGETMCSNLNSYCNKNSDSVDVAPSFVAAVEAIVTEDVRVHAPSDEEDD
ncbi:hypothetical protein E2562_034181 [Oryza meyeriana var. granulata]|uniref:Protein kinase domain-containing protein n=1 Tax=Oryza meyeriana var. granulata TaxID=110450 RepID=A0A6G1ESJ3_9ORYZ|nr:hypothetical protein E2562_034181 [Oryza meyeriana var. granulata]